MALLFGYKNVESSAGLNEKIEYNPEKVTAARVWYNVHCNPSYFLTFEDGSTIYTVDNYGTMNEIRHLTAISVDRRKDLFI